MSDDAARSSTPGHLEFGIEPLDRLGRPGRHATATHRLSRFDPSKEAAKRAEIVAEALSWERTAYHPHSAIKGVGTDCAMFPADVYHSVGLVPELKPEYSSQWMLHRDEEQYLAWVTPYAREITRAELGPGDFCIWKFGRVYSHGAIVIEPPEVIHALIRCGVVRGNIDRDVDLVSRPVRFFTLF